MKRYKGKLVAVDTLGGDKLIGYIVEKPKDITLPPLANGEGAIWLRRQTHLSFLAKEEVLSIRIAKPFEQESSRPV